MYERVVLAYDGSREGAIALREGAVLARRMASRVFVLSAPPQARGVLMAEAAYGGAIHDYLDHYRGVLDHALARLRGFGFEPEGRLTMGDPVRVIGAYAAEVDADLVVVGHRKRSLIERWWSGPSGAYLSDVLTCSLLIARNVIDDATFDALMQAAERVAPPPTG